VFPPMTCTKIPLHSFPTGFVLYNSVDFLLTAGPSPLLRTTVVFLFSPILTSFTFFQLWTSTKPDVLVPMKIAMVTFSSLLTSELFSEQVLRGTAGLALSLFACDNKKNSRSFFFLPSGKTFLPSDSHSGLCCSSGNRSLFLVFSFFLVVFVFVSLFFVLFCCFFFFFFLFLFLFFFSFSFSFFVFLPFFLFFFFCVLCFSCFSLASDVFRKHFGEGLGEGVCPHPPKRPCVISCRAPFVF